MRIKTVLPWMLAAAMACAQAQQDKSQHYARLYASALLEGACQPISEKPTAQPRESTASNEPLHMCQYVQEMQAQGCLLTKACPSYEAWSAQNPQLSPALPREAFVRQLEARRQLVEVTRRAQASMAMPVPTPSAAR